MISRTSEGGEKRVLVGFAEQQKTLFRELDNSLVFTS